MLINLWSGLQPGPFVYQNWKKWSVEFSCRDSGCKLFVRGGARGVMVIVVENGHGDISSNTGRDWVHFT